MATSTENLATEAGGPGCLEHRPSNVEAERQNRDLLVAPTTDG
jgi:hypothetical protein